MSAYNRAIELYLGGSTVEEARHVVDPPLSTAAFYKVLDAADVTLRGRVSRRQVLDDNATLVCLCCNVSRPVTEFSTHPTTRSGYDPSRCKHCKRSKQKWADLPIERRIFNRVKGRALNRGIEFDLEPEDIVLPEECPVFKRPFVYGDHKMTYSVDRKDYRKGYTRDNIAIISNKANMMKSIATTEEVRQLYEWMKDNGCP